VSRYSKADDIVVDYFADNSWIAMGCISLTDSRYCIGGVEKEDNRVKLNKELAECLIYQAGQGRINMLSSKLMDRLGVFKRRHRDHILTSSSHPAHLFFFLPPTTLSVHLPYVLL